MVIFPWPRAVLAASRKELGAPYITPSQVAPRDQLRSTEAGLQ